MTNTTTPTKLSTSYEDCKKKLSAFQTKNQNNKSSTAEPKETTISGDSSEPESVVPKATNEKEEDNV